MRLPRGLFACLALTAAACAKQGAAPSIAPLRLPKAPAVVEFNVKETRLLEGAVFVHFEAPPHAPAAKATVISMLSDTHDLLAAGFNAVTYKVNWDQLRGPAPAPLPIERSVGKWVLASPSPALLGERYLREIAGSGNRVVPAILDWLQTLPEVDSRRFGIVGVSTTGFVTLQAVAADRRIGAAVAVAACGDYHRFLAGSSMGIPGEPLALEPAYDDWLRDQEIIHHPEAVVHAALLMQNRVTDELIPIACADETARILAAAYARAGVSERFHYERSEEEGHGIDRAERKRALAWLVRWLQSGE